jgi:hypothetical protein
MLERETFVKMLYFDLGYVISVYVPIYLVSDACRKYCGYIACLCLNFSML